MSDKAQLTSFGNASHPSAILFSFFLYPGCSHMFTEPLRLASLCFLVLPSHSHPSFSLFVSVGVHIHIHSFSLQTRAHPHFMDTRAPDKKRVRHPRSCSVCLFTTELLPCAFLNTRIKKPTKVPVLIISLLHTLTHLSFSRVISQLHTFLSSNYRSPIPSEPSIINRKGSKFSCVSISFVVVRSLGASLHPPTPQ